MTAIGRYFQDDAVDSTTLSEAMQGVAKEKLAGG
jgi:hypothetical protein